MTDPDAAANYNRAVNSFADSEHFLALTDEERDKFWEAGIRRDNQYIPDGAKDGESFGLYRKNAGDATYSSINGVEEDRLRKIADYMIANNATRPEAVQALDIARRQANIMQSQAKSQLSLAEGQIDMAGVLASKVKDSIGEQVIADMGAQFLESTEFKGTNMPVSGDFFDFLGSSKDLIIGKGKLSTFNGFMSEAIDNEIGYLSQIAGRMPKAHAQNQNAKIAQLRRMKAVLDSEKGERCVNYAKNAANPDKRMASMIDTLRVGWDQLENTTNNTDRKMMVPALRSGFVTFFDMGVADPDIAAAAQELLRRDIFANAAKNTVLAPPVPGTDRMVIDSTTGLRTKQQ